MLSLLDKTIVMQNKCILNSVIEYFECNKLMSRACEFNDRHRAYVLQLITSVLGWEVTWNTEVGLHVFLKREFTFLKYLRLKTH